jgi:hypothetical protein
MDGRRDASATRTLMICIGNAATSSAITAKPGIDASTAAINGRYAIRWRISMEITAR